MCAHTASTLKPTHPVILRIDPQNPSPLFEQVVRQVKDAVANGTASPDSKLPSVRELARDLTINPNTVVKAYDRLEQDGVIYRRQGAGCFVTGQTNNLTAVARRSELETQLTRLFREAAHLGFLPAEVLALGHVLAKSMTDDALAAAETTTQPEGSTKPSPKKP